MAKKINLLLLIELLFSSFIFGQTTYTTVYSCNFENGENLTKWETQTAGNPEFTQLLGSNNFTNNFYINTMENSYSGENCLYISENNGVSNTVTLSSTWIASIADLKINLSPGYYKLSLVYKNVFTPPPYEHVQYLNVNIYSTLVDFNDFIDHQTLPACSEPSLWTTYEFGFNIPSGQQANHIIFYYLAFGTETVEAVAIDSLVIQKDVSTLQNYNISGKVTLDDGTPLIDVNIDCDNCITTATTTNQNGEYYFVAKEYSDITINPYLNDFAFNPQNIPLLNITENIENQDFIAFSTATVYYIVSGTVKKDGIFPLEGVNILYTDNYEIDYSEITDQNGYYEFAIEANKEIIITPILSGFSFYPTSDTITTTENKIVNFSANSIGINNNTENNISIFPNPANEILFFNKETIFELTDIQGKTILKSNIAVQNIDIRKLKAGIYFVKIEGKIIKLVIF